MNASPSTIRRARAVFQCAIELEGDERDEFVRDACNGDETLLSFVESLLAADLDEGASFTMGPLVERNDDVDRSERRRYPLPSGYSRVRELGVGGSGRVELCRDNASGSLVAIKIVDLRGLGQGGVPRSSVCAPQARSRTATRTSSWSSSTGSTSATTSRSTCSTRAASSRSCFP
jgi:hypothetical protein